MIRQSELLLLGQEVLPAVHEMAKAFGLKTSFATGSRE